MCSCIMSLGKWLVVKNKSHDSVLTTCQQGLALQSSMFANTAYIYVGSAASIAYTLGLHLQKTIKTKECLQRQIDLRIFSTLYLLDHDVALCYGNPTAISEDNAIAPLESLSEQVRQAVFPIHTRSSFEC